MSGVEDEQWFGMYRAAILELDPEKLPQLLEQAHKAVQERLRQVWQDGRDSDESQKLLDALQNLEVLRRS